MDSRTAGLGIALAASLGVNAWLWSSRGAASTTGEATASPARSAERAATTPGGASADPARGPRAGTPSGAIGGTGAASDRAAERSDPLSMCEHSLTDVEQRLVESDKKVAARLTLDEKFAAAAPSPDAEARLRDELAKKVFAGAPPEVSYSVECHGSVCSLEVVEKERGPRFDWQQALQTQIPLQSAEFSAGTVGQDPVSKDGIMIDHSVVELSDASTVDGIPFLQQIVDAAIAGGAQARCYSKDPTPGFLSLQLDLDAAHHVTITTGGTLASSPGGACLLDAVNAATAATTIPANARRARLYRSIDLPADGQ